MLNRPIIDWPAWTQSPPGRYILTWAQSQLDRTVANMFGYHALQLGLPELDALRENRMPRRALVLDPASGASAPYCPPGMSSAEHASHPPDGRSTVWCDFLDLPFATESVDLLILPHTLEFTQNPHLLLREVERVLVPEGRLIITGFNSLSLWGMRQALGRWVGQAFVPATGGLISFTRLKDWIKLLGFELDRGRFGCYRPPVSTEQWLSRYAFMEAVGDRWWPVFGAAYMITAIKRVRGMRLIGPAKTRKPVHVPNLTPIATPAPNGHSRGIPVSIVSTAHN